jgi:hypothetical protein
MTRRDKDERGGQGPEGRRAGRAKHACLAWVEGPGIDLQGIARMLDLSSRGVGLVLTTKVPAGERVVVDILVAGHLKLRASGVVRHCAPMSVGQFRCGVEFDAAPVLTDNGGREAEAWRT